VKQTIEKCESWQQEIDSSWTGLRKTKGKNIVIIGFAEGDNENYNDLIVKVVNQGSCLGQYFNIFIHDILGCIKVGNRPSPVVAEPAKSCRFFANDILAVAMGSFTTDGLQQTKNQAAKFRKTWGPECNLR
jgi:hypothetical protein